MNNIAYGIGGLVIGAISGIIGTHLYYKKKIDNLEYQVDELDHYVNELSNNLYKKSDDGVNPVKGADNGRDDGPLSESERQAIKEKLDKNWAETTNYASMFVSEELGTGGEPDDDEEDPTLSEDEKQGYVDAMEATEEHAKNRNRKPKIISEEAIGELPAYFNRETFFFYDQEGILTDEENNEIVDPETYLGDSLTKYGFDQNEEERIFVVNYRLDSIFEVQKMKGDYYAG